MKKTHELEEVLSRCDILAKKSQVAARAGPALHGLRVGFRGELSGVLPAPHLLSLPWWQEWRRKAWEETGSESLRCSQR